MNTDRTGNSADGAADPEPYCGRFAPSPTGLLHLGSLIAAVGSFLEARARGGRWLVRMEDLDPPREVAGAADAILRLLDVCQLHWDGMVVYQSTRSEAYEAALGQLSEAGMLYECACTRRAIAQAARAGGRANVYPGTCRNGPSSDRHPRALRVRVHDDPIGFCDRLQGEYSQRLESALGDFIVKRSDGLYAYQLAVVVDDAWQGVTDVIRGSDLLDNTPRQIYLQGLLGLSTPGYLHLPVAINQAGRKLSKQTRARPVTPDRAGAALWQALELLGQSPPRDLLAAAPATILHWAQESWQTDAIPPRTEIPATAAEPN